MVLTQIRLSEQALDLSLTTAKIAALAVTTAKIDDLAVTTAKIDALAVTTAKIDALAVTTAKIADLNVTTAKIADANVTVGKLSDFTPSDGGGLAFNVAAGRVRKNNIYFEYAGGSITLPDNSTSFVEMDIAGTLYAVGGGFTARRLPIGAANTAAGIISGPVVDLRSWATISFDEADSFVVRETPAGDLDGVDLTCVLAFTPLVGTEEVYLNGVLQNDGGNDYSISGATITFVDAPVSTDKVLVSYRK